MIRIITIHHESDRFLKLQEKYFETNTADSYIVYCGIYNFKQPQLGDKYKSFDLKNISIHHADRLNYLWGQANLDASDDDILIFMDSDSLPITNDWVNVIKNNLAINPITAIQRKENGAALRGCISELHPHPCFFVTTVKFWRENNLSFNTNETAGYDIGEWLKRKKLDFTPILRSTSVDLHPLYFGVYGNIIYHHGAGNRLPYDGIDICRRKGLGCGPELDLVYPRIPIFNQKLSELIFNEIINDNKFIRNYLMGIT